MLEVYTKNTTVITGQILPFDAVSISKGCTSVLVGSGTIQLNKCGVYMIDVDIEGLPTDNGTLDIEMLKSGVSQSQAELIVPNVTTSVGVAASRNTLVQVSESNSCCCCKAGTTIQFQNSGVNLSDCNFSVTVTKVC